jgi:hypothetical protein
MVFLPPGIASIGGAGCGVHFKNTFGSTTYPLATVTDIGHDCQAGVNSVSPYQQITVTASHELYETMTDPFSGSGWNVPNSVPNYGGQELGDLCDTHPAILPGGAVKQRTWSNRFGECINGMAWVAPSFTRFATQDTGATMGLFWATGDGGIAEAFSTGNGTWGSAAEVTGSNVPGPGQSCYWDAAGYNSGNSGPSHIPIQFTCFEGGDPVAAVSAGSTGIIKVFGALNGGVNEFVTGSGSSVTESKKSAFQNKGDVGSGYPVTAVDAQLGNGEVRVAWTTNQGGIDVGLLNGDDSVYEFKQNLAPANSIVPGTTVTMLVPEPGKAMLFWALNGTIWELSYDCFGQTSCAKGAGTWTGPTNVDTIAGVVPGATVSAVEPSAGNVNLFWTKQSFSVGSIWTKSFNYVFGWTGDTDLYDEFGSPVQVGDAAPGTDIVAVSTTPGGITLVWPSLSGGGIFAGVLPPNQGTTAFGPAQLATSAGLTTNASVITAIPNSNGVDKELTLWWQVSQGASLGRPENVQYNPSPGGWSGTITLPGVLMVP